MNYGGRKYWAMMKIRHILHEYLIKNDPEYRAKSKDDQDRIVLIAVSEMICKFDKVLNSRCWAEGETKA
jgi:hypothetical protein